MRGKYHVYIVALEEPCEVDLNYNRRNERIVNGFATNDINELVEETKKLVEDTRDFVLTPK